MQDPDGSSNRATAMSVYDQANGMNDFPVLKAFQEYIDAEQARARKRMLWLSIFFVTLLVVVVVTFSVIMATVINRDQQNLSMIATRNQELSDKLLDIALRERTAAAHPVVNVQQPPPQLVQQPPQQAPDNAAVLKPVLEKLEKLASSFDRQQAPVVVQAPPSPSPAAAALAAQPVVATPDSLALQRQQEALRQQREAISAERAKLKAEQERLRQEQVERHRRRLYPEYYAREDARKQAEESDRKGPVVPSAVPPPPVQAAHVPAQAATAPVVMEAKPVDLKTAKPISYFSQEDEDLPPAKPVKVESPSSPSKSKPVQQERASTPPSTPSSGKATTPVKTEILNIGAQSSNQIPWLIELQEKK